MQHDSGAARSPSRTRRADRARARKADPMPQIGGWLGFRFMKRMPQERKEASFFEHGRRARVAYRSVHE